MYKRQLYAEQLSLDMKVNILRPSGWGSYKRIDMTDDITMCDVITDEPILLLNKLK